MVFRKLLVVTILVLSGLPLAAAPKETAKEPPKQAPTARQADEQAIRQVAKEYLTALANGDGKAAAAFWVPGGDIIDESRVSHPASELLAQVTKAVGSNARPTVKLIDSSIRFLTADSAIEDGTSEVTEQPPSTRPPMQGHFSAVWVRQQGKWKLASLREIRLPAAAKATGPAEQLVALDALTGDWRTEQGGKTFEVEAHWNSNHTFLIRELDVHVKGQTVHTATQRIGWDAATNQIKSWTFDSGGGHGESTWAKDADGWVVHAQTTLADGSRVSSTNTYRFDNKDTITWKSTGSHGKAGPLADVELKLVRDAAAAAPAATTSATSPAASNQKNAANTSEEAKKAAILSSARWRRAIFEMNEWFSTQSLYDKKQIEQMKRSFNERVAKMSSTDLQFMLDDMDKKFQILDSREAQDTRAWLGQYLSILSDKKREEEIKKIPNVTTMTAAQLSQTLANIDEKRDSLARERQALQDYKPPTTNPWDPGAKAAAQAYIDSQNAGQYYSPYSAAPLKKPFSDVHQSKPSIGYYITPFGGMGETFNPGLPDLGN